VAKFQLVLLIHAHQPVGNFEKVLEAAYQKSYQPFTELLEKHPRVHAGLHYSGTLLEWLERAHPEFLEKLRRLTERGQAEIVGGGFYEPVLAAIPAEDRLEQLRRMADWTEERLGRRPEGAWLAERVWEPSLPTTLEAAGVRYTLVDDNHFVCAGMEERELLGYYIAEDCGATVRLIPGLKALRYLIPYRRTEEVIQRLHEWAEQRPGGMAAMGDDCEKFGVWPKTYEHCYRDGWLESFFRAIEGSAEWLETATPGAALESRAALGRADLPTASYAEMGEWSLPTEARKRLHRIEQEFAGRGDVREFLRGGFWRIFLTKYPEANLMHKKMLHVSGKLRKLRRSRKEEWRRAEKEARTLLLRGQCNDAYWHGVFGGLYAPHLRTAVLESLAQAEEMADRARHGGAEFAEAKRLDYDADGAEEIYLTSERYAALVTPAHGGTMASLDCRAAGVTLLHAMARRPEAYHERLAQAGTGTQGAAVSIHERVRAKEAGLEKLLKYDRWRRQAFRLLVFAKERGASDYQELRLDAHAELAAGRYETVKAGGMETVVRRECADGLGAEKKFSFARTGEGFEVRCEVKLTSSRKEALEAQAGIEMVVNLLAADEPDRYFETGETRHPLGWAGAAKGPILRAVDEWRGVTVEMTAEEAREFWIAPIETVSDSEEGFEKVYQGSQILAVWPARLEPGGEWKGVLRLRVTPGKRTVAR
jgi:4-alpha-glucanotransferase